MGYADVTLYGNYSFDGVKNAGIHHSRFLSKDAFWNSENVTVHDSFISGEYLGWNAKNLTLVNCTIESLQGMCYIESLVMKNCKLLNTTLAFEFSTVDADINGKIDSVMNPSGGVIRADSITQLILDKDKVNPERTAILCKGQKCDYSLPVTQSSNRIMIKKFMKRANHSEQKRIKKEVIFHEIQF